MKAPRSWLLPLALFALAMLLGLSWPAWCWLWDQVHELALEMGGFYNAR